MRRQNVCWEMYFQCETCECIPYFKVCNCFSDCMDMSDEDSALCSYTECTLLGSHLVNFPNVGSDVHDGVFCSNIAINIHDLCFPMTCFPMIPPAHQKPACLV